MESATVGTHTFRRPRAALYPGAWAVADSGAAWCIAYVDADDFTLMDADPQCNDLFEGRLDGNAPTFAALRAFLSSVAVGDVPAAARTRIQNRLTTRGVDLTGMTLATPIANLVERAIRFHCADGSLDELEVVR